MLLRVPERQSGAVQAHPGQLAAGGGVELEHLVAVLQLRHGFVDTLAFGVGAWRALEADQTVQRRLELHADLLRVHGNVELGHAVLVRTA